MMSTTHNLSQYLEAVAQSLDITDTQYKQAVGHYRAVADWLTAPNSILSGYNPEVYTQGSFRLGTVIKPVTDKDEYDIDLVCELCPLNLDVTSPGGLKHLVGKRLKENKLYGHAREGRYCWEIKYAEGTNFHMDIVPATSNNLEWLGAMLTGNPYYNTMILVTDKKKNNWLPSNPKGYAEWFKSRMELSILWETISSDETYKASIETVPYYTIKTSLQKVVQLLKRHRDIYFQQEPKLAPASIIITTLAAQAYKGENDLLEALKSLASDMSNFIKEDENENSVIANPANPAENFADRWIEKPELKHAFYEWLGRLEEGVASLETVNEYQLLLLCLNKLFGVGIVKTALVPRGRSLADIAMELYNAINSQF